VDLSKAGDANRAHTHTHFETTLIQSAHSPRAERRLQAKRDTVHMRESLESVLAEQITPEIIHKSCEAYEGRYRIAGVTFFFF
jgi:hypothetical protein